MKPIRINKFISYHSPYSRREAEVLLEQKRVSLNGTPVSDPVCFVHEHDLVSIDGQPVRHEISNNPLLIAYNKPKGELVTKRDPKNRRTIYHSLPAQFMHYIPVGRLDGPSQGLLLLTQYPPIAHTLMNAPVPREYHLIIDGSVSNAIQSAMKSGIYLSDARAGAHRRTDIREMDIKPFIDFSIQQNAPSQSALTVRLSEGKNRELRRFFAHFGLSVLQLVRLAYANIRLLDLKPGKTREITQSEINELEAVIRSSGYEWLVDSL